METDRELLELAAKAAGVEWDEELSNPHPVSGAFFGLWLKFVGEPPVFKRRNWNPLTDDGDALRLAVKLELDVGNGTNPLDEDCIMVSHAEKFGGWFEEPRGDDHYAATRRAVVRAAAEIGKDKT